jgi:sec-independent protein translocase protein TatC
MADVDAVRGPGIPGLPASSSPEPEPPRTLTPAAEMPLVDHLVELRNRLVRIALAVLVTSIVGFVFGDQIIAVLKAPIPGGRPLFFTGLGDAFMIRVKVALVVGVILAMPVLLWQGWGFISPGLTEHERRVARPWIPLALVFFSIGVGIAYLILPYAAGFLIGFSTPDLQPLITAEAYFDFVTMLFLVFGLVMEFPILLFGLAAVGILPSERLRRSRRQAILGISTFSLVITPGADLVSPFALAFTMYILFELTVFFIRRSGK